MLDEVPLKQHLDHAFGAPESGLRRHRVGVNRMGVAPRRQHIGILHDVCAGPRLDILAAQRTHKTL
jgi:hypothetical protein